MPFISGRSTFQRITGALAAKPTAPTLGIITASINSPDKVGKPTMSQDENNATFTWTAPSAGGVALSVPFTAPSFNGGLPIINYEYSTDNGSTWKSSGSTSSPITITTVSSSSSSLSANTSYTVRLRAVNALGAGAQTSGSSKTTPATIDSYTVKIYDNYPTNNELVETVTGHSTLSISRSHFKVERDWSVTVAAVNSNGTGTYSDESDASTGWRYTSYNADYARTRTCTTSTGCDSCGTKTGTEDGTVARDCYQWTRSGSTPETGLNCVYRTVPGGTEEQNTTWAGNCRDTGPCSGSWSDFYDFVCVPVSNGLFQYVGMTAWGWMYYTDSSCNNYGALCNDGYGSTGIYGPENVQRCSATGTYRVTGSTICIVPSCC